MNRFLDELLSRTKDKRGRSLKNVISELPSGAQRDFMKLVDDERRRPPEVAIIGKTGVGKSSTINALFGKSLKISHTRACTQSEKKIQAKHGSTELIVVDMPGLLEDIDKDEDHKRTYARVIPQCDVAVWVLDATDRAMAEDQRMIRDVVSVAKPELADRLVIGLNKIDEMQPGEWLIGPNIPSQAQKESIKSRISDIMTKLLKVCPSLTSDRIVPYSALRRYRLRKLFNAMLDACPKGRAWVLHSRESIADYKELIDPQILAEVERRRHRK
jgi:small GTP-binding protein